MSALCRAKCCDAKGGKCKGKDEVKVEAEAEGEAEAPAPPAPVVDPSAFLKSQRRVIHASTNLVR